VDERLRFVARLLDGEKMAPLCREFGISRKTGYKIFHRYKDCGLEGLTDRSRRPYRQANQLPMQIERLIVRLKKEKPAWGAPKIRERLLCRPGDPDLPDRPGRCGRWHDGCQRRTMATTSSFGPGLLQGGLRAGIQAHEGGNGKLFPFRMERQFPRGSTTEGPAPDTPRNCSSSHR
jgi:hypothetical protein